MILTRDHVYLMFNVGAYTQFKKLTSPLEAQIESFPTSLSSHYPYLSISASGRVLKMHEIASKKVGENCVSNEENVWKRLSEVISSEVVSRHMVAVFYFRFRIRKL